MVVDDPAGPDWRQLPLCGHAADITAEFLDLPHRQLVVLGEAGAGKSILAMLLTLGLLNALEPGEPVPVFLPVASWNPAAETVDAFLARRLSEDYTFLGQRSTDGRSMAEVLVARGAVLPILDGMDELPGSLHARAIRSLDTFAATGAKGRSLVVTCRSHEYEQAVRHSGSILSRAAVVEIEPVTVEQAIDFLSHPEPGRPRWEPVFQHLRDQPTGALARVLSTPLMVTLARAAYRRPTTDPADLLAMNSSAALTNSLISSFVPSVYQDDQAVPVATYRRRFRQRRPEDVDRWLGCLAYHLYLTGTRDLWWWRLSPTLLSIRPRRTMVIVRRGSVLLAAGIGCVVSLLVKSWHMPWAAITGGLIVAVSGARSFRSMWPAGQPLYVPHKYWSTYGRWIGYVRVRLTFGVLFGVMTGLIIGHRLLGIAGGGACGLAAIMMPTARLTQRAHRPAPRDNLRAHRRYAVSTGVRYEVTAGAIFAGLAALGLGRAAVITSGCTAAVIFLLAASFGAGLRTLVMYKTAHVLLAARNWLPWRLWTFLDEAHSRGILRLAGTAWQFRHALLQDHLASHTRLRYLLSRVEVGDQYATGLLIDVMERHGQIGETRAFLRDRADRGDRDAAHRLAGLLEAQGRTDEAIAIWRERANHRDRDAAHRLAGLLEAQGRTDEAIAIWRERANHRDRDAAHRLAGLLEAQGRTDEAIAIWRERANHRDRDAAHRLAGLLEAQGRTDEAITVWRERASHRDRDAAHRLTRLLESQGRSGDAVEIVRQLASKGDRSAIYQLMELERQGRTHSAVELWRRRARKGDWQATEHLADTLEAQGRTEEAIALLRKRARKGDWHANMVLPANWKRRAGRTRP